MRFHPLSLFIGLFSLLFCVFDTSADVCTLSSSGFSFYSSVFPCLTSIPFDPYVRNTTLDTLAKSLPLFTFQELAANPPYGSRLVIPPTDLENELRRIQAANYSTDFEFQQDLVEVYIRLSDAHSLYFRPTNYASISAWQPFTLVQYLDQSGDQIVEIAPLWMPGLKEFYESNGIPLSAYEHARVLAVDGIDAIEYFTDFAYSSVGLSKDLSSRFDFAFTRPLPIPGPNGYPNATSIRFNPGMFQKRRGLYNILPTSGDASVHYTIMTNDGTKKTINIPWAAQSSKNFASVTDWTCSFLHNGGAGRPECQHLDKLAVSVSSSLDQYSARSHVNSHIRSNLTPRDRISHLPVDLLQLDAPVEVQLTESEFRSLHERVIAESIVMDQYHDKFTQTKKPSQPSNAASANYTLIAEYGIAHIYMLADGVTMVLYLESMEPALTPNGTLPQKFIDTIETGFATAISLGAKRLIIELDQNGGGLICWGISMVSFLFQNSLYHDSGLSPSDMPQSDLAINLTRISAKLGDESTIWAGSGYTSYPNNVTWGANDVSWLLPGHSRQRGAGFRSYSELLDLSAMSCEGFGLTPLASPFPPSSIVLVTHGFCGSTCALFSNHLHQWEGVRAVAVGGLAAHSQQQFFAFPGIQVVDSPDFYAMFESLEQNVTTFAPWEFANSSSIEASNCPRLMYTSAAYRYCIREQYNRNSYELPVEYTFTPANYHWPNTKLFAYQPYTVWNAVANQLFD